MMVEPLLSPAPERPTVFVTNLSSRTLHGPGRRYNIIARPRHWELQDGNVPDLTPSPEALDNVRRHVWNLDRYRAEFERLHGHKAGQLAPGALVARWPGGWDERLVEPGSTLFCSCSREEAAAGRCHRVWAARFLARAGWRVVLDGREVEVAEADDGK